MSFGPAEPRSFHRFLDKFSILDQIPWDEELIDISIKDVCQQLDLEVMDFCWMDFSINKYMGIGWHKTEAISFIHERFQTYRPGKVGLILSLKYESLKENQRQHAAVISDPKTADILFGIDLVGDEAYFDAQFYSALFEPWIKQGKMVRAHVGESQTHTNILDAIDLLKVTNIAHGFKCLEDEKIIKAAIDNNIQFDMAITSNYATGALDLNSKHPIIEMMDRGLQITIGSDDPTQFGIGLDHEYRILSEMISSEGKKPSDYITKIIDCAVKSTNKFNRLQADKF